MLSAARRAQCPRGTPVARPCAAGTYSTSTSLASGTECAPCPVGFVCELGTSVPQPMCGEQQYRPAENSSASECKLCDAVPGVICGANPTIATLNLSAGYWRHSEATIETHRCKLDGSWSPCVGGGDAGIEGVGYCAAGYRGPRCELCDGPAYTRYFDKLEARCHECGSMTARTVVLVFVMILLTLVAAISGTPALPRRLRDVNACSTLLRSVRYVRTIWQDAGMQYKIKLLVGFSQCLAATPSVFNVQPPLGLEHITRWIHLLELPSEFERIFAVPIACLGDYQTRIWIGSTWPLVVVLACAACFVGSELLQSCGSRAVITLPPTSGSGQHLLLAGGECSRRCSASHSWSYRAHRRGSSGCSCARLSSTPTATSVATCTPTCRSHAIPTSTR